MLRAEGGGGVRGEGVCTALLSTLELRRPLAMGETDDALRGIARYEIQKRVGDGTYGYVNLVRTKVCVHPSSQLLTG